MKTFQQFLDEALVSELSQDLLKRYVNKKIVAYRKQNDTKTVKRGAERAKLRKQADKDYDKSNPAWHRIDAYDGRLDYSASAHVKPTKLLKRYAEAGKRDREKK